MGCRRNQKYKLDEHFQPFYHLLNIALKFLSRHNALSIEEVNFNRKSYRFLLLFGTVYMIALSGFTTFSIVIPDYQFWCVNPPSEASQDVVNTFCGVYRLQFILSFGCITLFLNSFIFLEAVVISLVGLLYGAEISFRMSKSWIARFSDLRKLHEELQSKEWDDSNMNRQQQNEFLKLSTKDIVPHISRDAFEHYLYMRRYMKLAGNIWSGAIVGMFCLMIFLSATYALALYINHTDLTSQKLAYFLFPLISNFLILFVFPLCCIAHANEAVSPLYRVILASGNDYYYVYYY